MNPMKIMEALNTFRSNHPKVVQFVQHVFGGRLEEDTIIEISVKKPGQEPVTTNMKIKQSDIDMMEEIKNMRM